MATKSAGVIRINLSAGTAQFLADMDKSNAKLLQFQKNVAGIGHGVSGVQATSGALRVLEGGLNNNLRAAERFTANILGLGPILQKAFPVIGGLAFVGLLGKMGDEAYKFYTTLRDAPEKSADAFRDLSAGMKRTNDELLVTDDRLAMSIAKFEGKRQNTLKLALDEARVAADKLADALDADLKKIAKVLEENKVSWFERFTGTAQTTDIKELVAGKSGVGGLLTEEAKITREGQLQIDQAALAGDLKKQDAARLAMNNALIKLYSDTQAKVNTQLKEAIGLQKSRTDVAAVEGPSYPGTGAGTGQLDVSRRVSELQELQSRLQDMRVRVQLQARVDTDTAKNEALEAAAAGAKLDRPFAAKLTELQAQVAASGEKMKAAGLDSAGQLLAKSMGDALVAIAEVNRGLEKQHEAIVTINSTRGQEILSLVTARDKNDAEAAWVTKLTEAREKIQDQIKGQELLNGAIGRGWEAERKVAAEIALMSRFTPAEYNDPGRQTEIQAAREQELALAESKHREELSKTSLALRDQIGLQTALARAQSYSAEAVRLAELQYRMTLLLRDGKRDLIQNEIELYNATRANDVAGQVEKLDQEAEAVARLAAAYIQGAGAVRRAQLANQLSAISREGDTLAPGMLGVGSRALATAGVSQTEEQERIAKLAGETRLQTINAQIADLQQALAVTKDTAGIEMQLRDLDRERLQMMRDQALGQGSARDGMRAFFIEMQEQAEQTSKIVYDALNSALNDSSKNLAQMLTQKTPKGGWGQQWSKIR